MKIDYRETTSDLISRINIHDKYGNRNIDDWMLETLDLKEGMRILDVACGSGKQCTSFYKYLNGNCEITGGDVSKELLEKAKQLREENNQQIDYQWLDFNKPFNFPDDRFDLLSCCFAIYYSENIPFTIKEMHRVLKSGGKLFTTGPMPENKQVFYDIIKEATNKPIPRMPGSSRYASEILDTMKNTFSKVEVKIFRNPLTFPTADPFLEYTRASLSEDRKLWGDFFSGKNDFIEIMKAIEEVAHKRIEQYGKIVMTKVVGGFISTK
ncbi:MAG: methyltransferase domain-containing protein [Anaerolineaceae bacterium]|nr:methyltransferase domain-containing protein [Anaerolineaceae bacterium]